MTRWLLRAVTGLLLAWSTVVLAQLAVPPLTAHVVDQTGSLDAAQAADLEARLAAFERDHGAQVCVLIVPTTAPETIDQFGIRVAERWRLGHQGVDDGVVVLIALNDRAARIEVGYGLEGVLTDAASHRILAEAMEPRFRIGDIAGGVGAGVDRILALVGNSAASAPDVGDNEVDSFVPALVTVSMMSVAIGGLMRRWLGRGRAVAMTATLSGLLAGWLAGSIAVALLAALIAAVITQVGVMGWLPWRPGGGGAAFRGRGGGFGGGGASGRW